VTDITGDLRYVQVQTARRLLKNCQHSHNLKQQESSRSQNPC